LRNAGSKKSQEKRYDFAAYRQTSGLQVSTINSSLRVLRRVLKLAVEWGALGSSQRVKLLTGERHRERVVTPQEEAKYLAAAPEPLASVAAILCDTGLRPEECFRLRWEAVTWMNGWHGTLLVTHGKTASARRVLPMTPRVRSILETRWETARKPAEGWVWTAPTKSGHMESPSLKRRERYVNRILRKLVVA
jgi:integrase